MEEYFFFAELQLPKNVSYNTMDELLFRVVVMNPLLHMVTIQIMSKAIIVTRHTL